MIRFAVVAVLLASPVIAQVRWEDCVRLTEQAQELDAALNRDIRAWRAQVSVVGRSPANRDDLAALTEAVEALETARQQHRDVAMATLRDLCRDSL